MTTFENQITNYPKGARIEAIREIPLSSPSQNYYADPLPRGTRGVVTTHTDDGRAWINFDGHGQEGFGHTFEQPEKYIRVVCTHRDDNCPANHDAPAAPERGEQWGEAIAASVEALGLIQSNNVAAVAQLIQQHSTLIAQRERLLEIVRLLLETRVEMNGRCSHAPDFDDDCLQCQARAVLTTSEQEGTR